MIIKNLLFIILLFFLIAHASHLGTLANRAEQLLEDTPHDTK